MKKASNFNKKHKKLYSGPHLKNAFISHLLLGKFTAPLLGSAGGSVKGASNNKMLILVINHFGQHSL